MRIKTEQLKTLVSKASVGVGGNKLIPITELMGIKSGNGKMLLETTDGDNYVYVDSDVDTKDGIEVVVFAEQFAKLIGKLTSEYVSLDIEDGNLVVKANGTYTIELPLDENGEMIKYPDPISSVVRDVESCEVSIADVKNAVDVAKSSLATTLERPALTNYYVGDSIFATDGCIVTEYRTKLFNAEQMVSPKFMDILSSFTTSSANVEILDDCIIAKSDGMSVYCKVTEDTGDYALDEVKQFVGTKFNNQCKVDKSQLVSAIDRIALFVDKYDNDAIRLEFENDSIIVSNVKSGSSEQIEYKERKTKNKKKFEPSEVYINASMLMEQLKAYPGEVITIEHGTDFAISLVSEQTTQIVSLMEV